MQELYIQAEAFISSMQQFESKPSDSKKWAQRLQCIRESIETTGTYTHTTEELAFGAKLAWRNSNRCIGRHYWRQLDVLDCRSITNEAEIYKALEAHIEKAYNAGSIKSVTSIFAPRHPNSQTADPVRILNHQLIRYAGFEQSDGSIIGDPHSQKLTEVLIEQGWKPEKKEFYTPLPWSIQIQGKTSKPYPVFEKNPTLLKEIHLEHPENSAFKTLGLKWYSIPILSDMALVIGGIVYPCAPFNGWYMGTEIGARNLADETRYNTLPKIAELFKLDTKSNRSLWRDRALIELNRAVLHSFDLAGVRIGDHHSLTRQFEKFCEAEAKAQCPITGDWTWLVPPISASQTPTFSQEFDPEVVQHTNFFYQAAPTKKIKPKSNENGAKLRSPQRCPYHLN